jgi:hypothetical protein
VHLAQLNVAYPREPLESPLLAEFVAALEPVNALADRSPGFVWRLQDEAGDATGIRAFGDEGHAPGLDEAEERLDHLREHGPTGRGFTFREHFAEDLCPA